ncbi:MAG: hypothetical protein ACD_17C00018G0002 [uncultured bacterium]|nr:MAG: hypothetical protein ACD_17C00018G0002 [uncultured bacterium]OGN55727.1 MAG: hypothetical protein A2796_00980 [Chlamydiae bacterium RIFCSPHIGHO2_01_FULL_44_39]OGN58883.1 MAG: hypothetical protein A3C42_05105 [Chlamydiae bacterium RIFCSPHIGHO2_02_FULL_45_9]OGN60519.1 MAG: hypothetical protein A3D96_01405 [Chlamydiae bacterium RIFCSPHIGHO2_12_FULL_44_59]OGN65973.1 MAG: hypothetical protein A2978_04695 [Chlamydiae bacterium RIFCSPLOWO2_01_FULL_44_52]OGN68788.1 MAG: hypothetical protein A3
MAVIRLATTVVTRFFISLVFLAGAVNKILHWHDAEKLLLQTLSDWQAFLGSSDFFHNFLHFIIPLTPLILLVETLFELLGGLLVLLGIKEKLGALLLIFFLVPTTIIMHQFWYVDGAMRELQLIHFLKNVAIVGGLILIVLQGTTQAAPPKPRHPFQ